MNPGNPLENSYLLWTLTCIHLVNMSVADLKKEVTQLQQQLQQAQLDNNDLTEKLNNTDTTTQQHSSAPPVPQIQFTPHLVGVHPPPPLDPFWSPDESFQFAMLENCLGATAIKIYNPLEHNSSGTKSVSLILQKLKQIIIGELNETYERYRKVSNIRRTKSQNWNDSHLVLKSSFAQPFEARC